MSILSQGGYKKDENAYISRGRTIKTLEAESGI